ncbi:HEAT repeat domain-containing protein [Candidatus Riflebacteria bacterium]
MTDLKSKFKSQLKPKTEQELKKEKGLQIFKKCLNCLVENIIHKNYEIRKASVETLARFQNNSAVNFIIEQYRQDRLSDYLSLAMGKISTEETLSILLESLKDRDPNTRLLAAQALGNTKEEKALEVLLDSLKFYFKKEIQLVPGAIRSETAIIASLNAIARIGDKSCLPTVKQILLKETNSKIKATAASILAAIGGNEAQQIALIGLEDEDFRVQANSLETFINYGEIYKEKVKKFLTSTNNRVSGNAAMVLFPVEKSTVQKHLWEMFESEDKWIRCTAAFVMGKTKSPVFLEPLIKKMKLDYDCDVRRNCAGALEDFGDSHASLELINAYYREENTETRLSIAKALCTCLDYKHGYKILKLIQKEQKPGLLSHLILSLKNVSDREIFEKIAVLIDHKDNLVIQSTLEVVAENALVPQRQLIIPKLERLLLHENPRIRQDAIKTLWVWGEIAVLDQVLSLIRSVNTNEIIIATEVLREIGTNLNLTMDEIGIHDYQEILDEILRNREKIDSENDFQKYNPRLMSFEKELHENLNQHNFSKSIEILNEIINLNPKNDAWKVKQAEVFQKMGKPREAIEIFVRVLQKNPSRRMLFFRLGQIFYDLEEYKNSSWFLIKAVNFYPDLLVAYQYLIESLFYCHLFEQEFKFINLALTKEPKNIFFIKRWIRTSLEMDINRDECIEKLHHYLKLFPDDPELLFMQAQLKYLKDDSEALPLMLKIISNIKSNIALKSLQRMTISRLFQV